MIASSSIKTVIDRADIVEVIGSFIRIKKRGTNYIANCPFHNEKTPSFNINPARGIFKCFGCGKGGDVVSFVEEYEKFSFTESIRWLADFYKIDLIESEPSEEYKQTQQIEESLRIVNEFAAAYFHNNLVADPNGINIGGSYFKERGIGDKTMETFRLGYAFDQWDAFCKEAEQQGYNQDLLAKAGLIKVREDGKKVYDSYRDRVIFPIFSNTGRIIGFGARVLKKSDNTAKYMNTPENEIYIKNKVLYGLYQARTTIGKSDECLLVEGYMDVISLHQGGVTNAVASSGTSLTEGQLKLISSLTKNLTIIYDGDAAGIKAAVRGLDMALAHSFNVRLVLLPDGEDPDSYMQHNGAAAFQEYVKMHKRDVIEFRLELGMKESENDPTLRSKLVNELAETISKIDKAEDFTLQQYYIHETATKLGVEEEGLVTLVNKFTRERLRQEKNSRHQPDESPQPASGNKEQDPSHIPGVSESIEDIPANEENSLETATEDWQLVKVLLEYGDKEFQDKTVAEAFFEVIDTDILGNGLPKKLIEMYRDQWIHSGQLPQLGSFTNNPDDKIRAAMAGLLQDKYELSHNWKDKYKVEIPYGENNYKAEVESTIRYFELKQLRRFINENMEKIAQTTDMGEVMKLMQVHQMMKEREKELLSLVIVR